MEMEKRGFLFLNRKKAASPVIENVIFIVLNIMFFAIMILFVVRSVSNAVVYEQAYAKQIALLIDYSKPKTDIKIDLSKAISYLSKQSGKRVSDGLINIHSNDCFQYLLCADHIFGLFKHGHYFKVGNIKSYPYHKLVYTFMNLKEASL